MKHRLTAVTLLAASLFLSGCESSEERAEEHFQTGLELIEAGDDTRAAIEMRNVLQLVPSHAEARLLLADMMEDRGDLSRAVSHYRTLLEYHPQNGEAHLALAEIMLEVADWDTVRKHGTAAEEILGDNPRVAAISANLAYRSALEDEDREAREAALAKAASVLEANSELLNARRLVIDGLLRNQEWESALTLVDGGLEIAPERLDFARMRLGILRELGRTAEITAQLEDMVVRFPEDETIPINLVRWYVGNENPDAAENFLRARASEAPDDMNRQTQLVQFVNEINGPEAAIAELSRLSESNVSDTTALRAMRANLMFANGRTEEAMADLEALLADLPEDQDQEKDATANDIRVELSRMKALSGDTATAKSLVADALERDPSHTEALKMRAAWQIDEDQVDQAIVNLRSALRESPRDPAIMTLMAAGHERAGASQLQREMLALAVEASDAAPEESLRYARMLIADGRLHPAEDVLIEALRRTPNNAALLAELGRVYVALPDWPRAEQVRDTLRRLSETAGDPGAMAAMNALQAQILAGQDRDTELFGFLDELSEGETGLAAEIAILRAHMARGESEEARKRLDKMLAEHPDTPLLKFLSAAFMASEGKTAEAEAEMEALLADSPQAERVWMALYRLKLLQGDRAAAAGVLDRALSALPNGAELLYTRASELEVAGQVDEAIGIYESLYARNSGSEVVANNLASLLSIHRSDEETLDRAYRISLRLQDSQVPAFRDTYGWIAARLGRFEEAEKHLKFAVEGLAEHPVVQYHYAVTLAGLDRNDEALEHFRKAEELAGPLLPAKDLEAVKAEIKRLTENQGQ